MRTIKFILLTLVVLSTMLAACTKHDSSSSIQNQAGWIRVIGIKGTDTSSTKQIHARVETIGLELVEDSRLKAVLVAYQPLPGGMAKYTVEMTNKQSCQMILRWNYDNIGPIDPQPTDGTANTAQSDVLKGNQVKTYIIIGKAKLGRIYVQAQKSNSDCPNSSQLILEITTAILPIEFTDFTVDKKDGNYIVKFHTETPQDVDDFFIMWTPDGKKENESIRATIQSDHSTKDYKASFPIPNSIKTEAQ